MKEENIPLLMRFYFGENAERAQRGASRRLVKWSRAFEQWLAERRAKLNEGSASEGRLAWRRLARQCGKMPWEVKREDIEGLMRWMQEEEYAKGTINNTVGLISSFYDWCSAHGLDAACGKDFNPAKGVVRIRKAYYEGTTPWSREEVGRLLELVGRDASPLGRRELAFLKLRLSSGAPQKTLLQLKWEQIEQKGDEAWVRWREGSDPVKLEAETWQAIREWLAASGRLEGMTKEKYIFTPLRFREKEDTGGKAEDWVEEQAYSNRMMWGSLQIYGRKLGIGEEKLNWTALRITAIRLRLEAGESLEGMKRFMQSRVSRDALKYMLGKVPLLAQDEEEAMAAVVVPVRHVRLFKEGEGMLHGWYMRRKDPQAVKEVLEEGIRGVEQETKCLRELMEGLIERGTDDEASVEVYSMAAGRLTELITSGKAMEGSKEAKLVEESLEIFDKKRRHNSIWPSSEQVRAAAARWQGKGAKANVREEVATIRMVLRNIYRRASICEDDRQYLRLLDLYGKVCIRLMRMVKLEGVEMEQVRGYLRWSLDTAVKEVRREWGLDKDEEVAED